MFLLVPAHPGCPRQNPESRKTVVCVCVCVCGTSSSVLQYPEYGTIAPPLGVCVCKLKVLRFIGGLCPDPHQSPGPPLSLRASPPDPCYKLVLHAHYVVTHLTFHFPLMPMDTFMDYAHDLIASVTDRSS